MSGHEAHVVGLLLVLLGVLLLVGAGLVLWALWPRRRVRRLPPPSWPPGVPYISDSIRAGGVTLHSAEWWTP